MAVSLAVTSMADAGGIEPAQPPSGYMCMRGRCVKKPLETSIRRLKVEHMYKNDAWRITS